MPSKIDKNASVSPLAQLGTNVTIKPYAVVNANSIIGDNCVIESHAVVHPRVILGTDCLVGNHAVVGAPPQDVSFDKSVPTGVVVGDRSVLREFVTVHTATKEEQPTVIGNDCMIMVGSHIAHDCILGNNIMLVNNATLAGHVVIDNYAILSSFVNVHQFTRIGRYALVTCNQIVRKDVLPHQMLAFAHKDGRLYHWRLNRIALVRKGVDKHTQSAIVAIHAALRTKQEIDWSCYENNEELMYFRTWLNGKSRNGRYGFLTAS